MALSFINLKNKKKLDNIWNLLEAGLWKNLDIEAFLHNDILLSNQKNKQKPLFQDYLQVEPGLKYDFSTNELYLDLYYPRHTNVSFDNLLKIAEDFFNSLKAKRIGVHLSGGLDSSIIIAILHELNIPFVPIGLYSTTYEFRSERIIQEKLLSWGQDSLLIPMEQNLYYSKIKEIPKHQIPCGVFTNYAGGTSMAKAFKQRGCDIVLSGQGGDSLLVEQIKNNPNICFNINDEFINHDDVELIYKPYGINLISFFAHKPIIDFFTSARKEEYEDHLKWWARKWFKPILIPELTEYAYFADFMGINLWGLKKAEEEIKELFEESFELTKNPIFSKANIKKYLAKDIFAFNYLEYIKYNSLISYSVWLHSISSPF